MTSAALLVKLHHEHLVLWNGELVESEHCASVFPAGDLSDIVVGTEWKNHLFLYGSTLHNFLVYNLECNEIHIEGYVGGIADMRMEIQQSVVGVDSLEQELYSKSLTSDMLDMALVFLVNGRINKMHQLRRLATEFLQVDYCA